MCKKESIYIEREDGTVLVKEKKKSTSSFLSDVFGGCAQKWRGSGNNKNSTILFTF